MDKLTIIVPVYNREKTIKRTLDSIVNQLDNDINLIIINDGSTDNTEKAINEYVLKYSDKISYYSKQNGGIASTRNFGIEHAKSKYIMFVDSDDYIEENFFLDIKSYLEKDIDIIKFKLNRINTNGKILEQINGPVFENLDGQAAFNLLAFSDVLIDSPCIYVFKKELFIKNNLFFKEGTEHEDFGLIPLILVSAENVTSIEKYGYYYVQEENSITRNYNYEKTIKKMNDVLKHYDNMLEWIKDKDLKEITKNNLKTYYTNAIILKLKELNPKDQKEFIDKIKKRKMISNIKVRKYKTITKETIIKNKHKLVFKIKIERKYYGKSKCNCSSI